MATRVSRTGQRTSTRRRGGRRWSRAARFLWVMLALLVACAAIYCVKAVVAKAAKPIVIICGESKEVVRLKKEIDAAKGDKIEINHAIKDIDTAHGKEAEARRLGWVKKGETAIVVEQPQKTALESAEPIAGKSCWRRAGEWLTRLFHRRK